MDAAKVIQEGRATLGIEFGSTRIKAVLIDPGCNPIAQGSYKWSDSLVDGLWSYGIDEITKGMQECYADLKAEVLKRYGVPVRKLAAIGVSAMMHGYMAFEEDGSLLAPFRTWRNTNTGAAAKELSSLFVFNVPLRWSISHLYQAILDKEEHVPQIKYLTTLAGYIHWKLTGRKVLGVGDASGMIPVDPATCDYNAAMVEKFEALVAPCGFPWKLSGILPQVLPAGADAGTLTAEGARLLDPSGELAAGIPLCPPEGDAGTGMVATNSVRERTGNVSAGTSSFSMIVLEKDLSQPYDKIDIVTTPDGHPVAMVHCNNCTGELNAWVGLFREFAALMGYPERDDLFERLFTHSLEGDKDCGGLLCYNFLAGEPVVGFTEGRPLFVRSAGNGFTLANFFRMLVYTSVGALKMGNDILFVKEGVKVDRITAHGGLFITKGVAQRYLAAALDSPISVMETAGEGGAWGIALLAAFRVMNPDGLLLPDWLDKCVFAGNTGLEVAPTPEEVAGFNAFMARYEAGLPIEEAAVRFK